MPRKNFIIQVPIYPCEIMVSVGQSEDEVIKAVERWLKVDVNRVKMIDGFKEINREKNYGTTTTLHGTGFILLRIVDTVKTPNSHGTLAHEIFHVVESIADHCGIGHCEESSEAWAYLISHLTEQIYKKLGSK